MQQLFILISLSALLKKKQHIILTHGHWRYSTTTQGTTTGI